MVKSGDLMNNCYTKCSDINMHQIEETKECVEACPSEYEYEYTSAENINFVSQAVALNMN